jgi:hypothetical protein
MIAERGAILSVPRGEPGRAESDGFVDQLKSALDPYFKSNGVEYGRSFTMASFGLPETIDEYIGFSLVKIETKEEANNQQMLDVMVEVLGPQAGASILVISDKAFPHKCTSREHSFCLIDKSLFGQVMNLIDGLVQDEGLDFLGEVKSAFMKLWAVYFDDDSVPTAITSLNPRRILLILCIFRAYLCAFSKNVLKLGLALGSTMGAESVMKKVKQDTEKLSVTSKKLKQIVAGMNNLVRIGRQRSAAKMGVQQHSTMPMLLEGSMVETPDATAARCPGNRASGCLDDVSVVQPFLATVFLRR